MTIRANNIHIRNIPLQFLCEEHWRNKRKVKVITMLNVAICDEPWFSAIIWKSLSAYTKRKTASALISIYLKAGRNFSKNSTRTKLFLISFSLITLWKNWTALKRLYSYDALIQSATSYLFHRSITRMNLYRCRHYKSYINPQIKKMCATYRVWRTYTYYWYQP